MVLKGIVIASAFLLPVAANATLSSVAGGIGVYDSVTNLTWTSDANLFMTQATNYTNGSCGAAGSTSCFNAFVSVVIAASGGVIHDTANSYDTPPNSGTYFLSAADFSTATSGPLTWFGALAWVHYLNAINYGGSNQWALPTTVDNNASSGYPDGASGDPALSSSQMAQLFYGGLGQSAGVPIATAHNASFSLFSNFQAFALWSATEYSPFPQLYSNSWTFGPASGSQASNFKVNRYGALAESPGQLGSTSSVSSASDAPLPLWALAALGAGMVGVASRRLKKAK
jgi:hypothetical protein